MPPKKVVSETPAVDPTPVVEDPATILAREMRERQFQDDRRLFEKNEMMARRTVEAMEQVSWKCVYYEKEKRLDPTNWALKNANTSPTFVFIKRLVGNRAIPQQFMKIPITDTTTVGALKSSIHVEFVKSSGAIGPQLSASFAPDKQRLYVNGVELKSTQADELLKNVGVHSTGTVHVAFTVPATVTDLLPSMIN